MKDHLLLYKESNNRYYNILNCPKTSLRFLGAYFEIDYKSYYEKYLFSNVISSFNAYFVYNDKQNKMLYIGLSEWELDENMMCPSDEEFPNYVNETNSCKIGYNNFIEFRQKWVQLKQDFPSFALIYREDNDWVDCKGFETKEEMEIFVRNTKNNVIH